MEVKIKQGNEILDATVEMVDGVMVVSPKEVKFEPKDGDVVASPCGKEFFIFKCNQRDVYGECYFGFSFRRNRFFGAGRWHIVRFATEEEKKKLFDKLAEEGLEWKADTKELIKLKWKPEVGQVYWTPLLDTVRLFEPFDLTWREQRENLAILKRDWVFKTKEECQAFCDRLNSCILSIKP